METNEYKLGKSRRYKYLPSLLNSVFPPTILISSDVQPGAPLTIFAGIVD